MKRIVTLIVFMMSAAHGYGQKIRFTDTSNKWTYTHITDQIPPFIVYNVSHYYSGDTVYNGVFYLKLNSGVLIREDTVLRKVFARKGLANDTTERVLFDHNLNVNDTVTIVHANQTVHSVVLWIDSVLQNSVWHRSWHFKPYNSNGGLVNYTVVEGTGCLYDILYPLYPAAWEPTSGLCSFINNSSYITGNATSCFLEINDPAKEPQKISVIPNPANLTSQLTCSKYIHDGVVIICNTLGQSVYTTKFSGQNTIPVGRYISVPGQYFYRLTDREKGQVYTGKFIFQ